jgi:hypothetical protein
MTPVAVSGAVVSCRKPLGVLTAASLMESRVQPRLMAIQELFAHRLLERLPAVSQQEEADRNDPSTPKER